MTLEQVQEKFVNIYNKGDYRSFHSPGRVNLIGEHTDYNGGFVFPCALDFGTFAVVRKNNSNKINFASTNFDLRVSITTENIKYEKEHDWANYLKGIILEFQNRGHKIEGFDILLDGNIPNGSGLSSSASIEVLMACVLNNLFNCNIDMIDMVKLSQHAENEFIGVKCGIMDQFAVGMGKAQMAMFLSCDKIEYKYVPIELGAHKLVIGNTKKGRGLADTKYNERRTECETAVSCLKKELNINFLGEITNETLEKYSYLIEDETVLKRAKHVVTEDDRVILAIEKLKNGDIIGFGELMNQSHISLRDLYEVTGTELDTMVEEAWKIKGTIGSRMTGAGFGGCTVSIVKDEYVDEFIKTVGENYTKRTGLVGEFYIANIGDGAKEL